MRRQQFYTIRAKRSREQTQHFTPNLTQLMRVGGLLEWDQHFTPNLTQLMRVGGLLEWDQHFTPTLSQLRRVGGLLEWDQHNSSPEVRTLWNRVQ